MKPYQIRPALSTDIPFIYSTWLKSYKHDSHVGLSVPKTMFFEQYRLILDALLANSSTVVLVACKDDEPTIVFGYLISEPSKNVLHYVFVKESFWGLGIAKSLFNQANLNSETILFTHKTRSVEPFLHAHPNFVFNPFILYQQNSKES